MTTRDTKHSTNQDRATDSDFAPLYAVAGLTDLIATEVRHRVARLQPAELQAMARKNAEELLAQYSALVGRGRTRVDDVRRQAEGLRSEAQGRVRDAYGTLVNAARSETQKR